MSEPKTEENNEPKTENKRKLKELANLLNQAANNPKVKDEELEDLVVSMMRPDPHRLDTAAGACPR
jgi:hypothetical protein